MRAALRIQALVGDPQPLYRTPGNQMFGHDLVGILRLDVSVPDSLRIDHHRGSVLALVKAARFINAHPAGQSCIFSELIQSRVQLALSIGCARRTRRIRRAGIMANKDVALERWQEVFSSSRSWEVKCAPAPQHASVAEFRRRYFKTKAFL